MALLQLSEVANLIPHEQAQFHRNKVADLLERRNLTFPGAQPVSFARKHFQDLQDTDYFVCEKTDGIRCLLYLTIDYGNGSEPPLEDRYLIDRKNDYYHIDNPHFHFPRPEGPDQSFHTDTLLDGELVLDTLPNGEQRRTYMVFDCLALDGKPLLQRTLDKRLGFLMVSVINPYNSLLQRYPTEVSEQPFHVMMKKLEKAYGIEMMLKDILPTLTHGNDGLIFTCRTTPYITGTDQHILKWKPPHENTIDFRLQLGDFPIVEEDGERFQDFDACPTFDLLVWHGGKDQFFAPLHIEDAEWEGMKNMNQVLDGRIIECYKDSQGRWRMKIETDERIPRFRDDKTHANHISTVNSVLESIEDAVSEDDLLHHAKPINARWKQREERAKDAAREAAKRASMQQRNSVNGH